MSYSDFYQQFEELTSKAFQLFKQKLKKENPDKNHLLKHFDSKIKEDGILLIVLNKEVFSSIGSFEKYEVDVPSSALEDGDLSKIEYDNYVTSGLGML